MQTEPQPRIPVREQICHFPAVATCVCESEACPSQAQGNGVC